MSAPMHTPGPWVSDRGVFIKAAGNGVKIATMRLSDGRGKDGREEREIDLANARLIAAAPELLEALERLAANCTADEPALKAADAAIAKARGAL